MSATTREPAVAGLFYPDGPRQLRDLVGQLLAEAPLPALAGEAQALIAPHAGYLYSGAVAAAAYRLLPARGDDCGLLAILGPNHRVPLAGMALDTHAAYRTPLGAVPVATGVVRALGAMPQVRLSDAPHRQEHCIEVHLPFLQVLPGDWEIVPVLVGETAPRYVAALLARLVEEFGARVLVSSDLSHYLPYREAQRADPRTAADIAALATAIEPEQACGCMAINGLNSYARLRGWRAHELARMNSGDTAADRSRVVGYGAYAYAEH